MKIPIYSKLSILGVILLVLVVPSQSFGESKATVADVQWKEASFPSDQGTKASLFVADHDMNTYPNAIDYVWVNVFSDSDRHGFRMTLFENDFNSGIFEGIVTFTATGPSGGGFLHTVDGDTITVKYVDESFPKEYESDLGNIVLVDEKLEMYATALAGRSYPPLERVPASNLTLTDVGKNPIPDNTVLLNQQITVTTDIENQMNQTQKFVYMVQIQNEKRQTESLSWLAGNLTSFQKINLGATWIPFDRGFYTATVFVWESITNPTALSPPIEIEFSVK